MVDSNAKRAAFKISSAADDRLAKPNGKRCSPWKKNEWHFAMQ
jgi:hypothetical protein